MTAEEKELGLPRSILASHTEARALRQIQLNRGQTMTITGQQEPCPTCKGLMNQAAQQTGPQIKYHWRQAGETKTWQPTVRKPGE